LAAAILVSEMIKGVGCVLLGAGLAGQEGMVAAGIGAALGNVANPYRRLQGGQGLGIAAGILAAALPVGAIVGVVVIASVVSVVRASAPAALAALAGIVLVATWLPLSPWGLTDSTLATILAIGLAGVIVPKQIGKLGQRSQ
jgi:glycerol-3-phosphate acyltransferase PlsY